MMADHVEQLAQKRAKYLTGMIWHLGAFVIINAFLWILDLITGPSGAQWAFWITLFWGLALLFHVLAFFVDGRQLEQRMTRKYTETYRASDTGADER